MIWDVAFQPSILEVNDPRTKNQAAHKMAEARKHFDSPMFWIEEAPEKVTRIVDLDRGSMGREEVLKFSE